MSQEDPTPARQRKPRSGLSSVATAMRLLKAFTEDEDEIGVSALAAKLGVAKSTVHRLATTLVSEGMLEQNPDNGKYRLSIALFSLGALVRRRMDLSSVARHVLFELRDRTHETVLLGVPALPDIMYVYNLESPQAISVRSDIGVIKPAFCTAIGRAILAFENAEKVSEVLAGTLEARTSETVTDPAGLAKILEEVRRLGYAVDEEESETGMRCIAAPVWNASERVQGAVGIAGPVQRLTSEGLRELAPALLEATASISRRLGYHR